LQKCTSAHDRPALGRSEDLSRRRPRRLDQRCAQRLGIQHSTVSRRLRTLEERLGTSLIERRGSGYELTEAGEELQLSASKIEVEILEFEGAQSGHDTGATGELRVTAINNMASTVLMPIFARFSEASSEHRASRPGVEQVRANCRNVTRISRSD
jgi:DNA-binding transcriptional LysR family regulator